MSWTRGVTRVLILLTHRVTCLVPLYPPVCLHLIIIIFLSLSKVFIVISVGILSDVIFSIVSTDNLSGECFLHRTSRSPPQQLQQQQQHLSTAAAVEAVDGVDAGAHHGVAVEEVAHAAVLRPGKRCQRNFAVALTIIGKNVPIPLASQFQVETTAKFRCHLHRSQCWQQELTQGPELLWVTVTNTSNNNNSVSNCILEPSTAAVASSTSTRSGLRRSSHTLSRHQSDSPILPILWEPVL